LLDEESEHWCAELLWDFGEVAVAVGSGIDRRSLSGRVAQDGSRVVAYCYYLQDSERAMVGSLFAGRAYRGKGLEETLLEQVLAEAQQRPGQRRVECQTLFSTAETDGARFESAGFTGVGREYLVCDLASAPPVAPRPVPLRALRREDLRAAAEVVHRSHIGSVDASLNLTYSSPGLCRSFVETLVLRNGCGRFDSDASAVIEDGSGLAAVLLASQLSRRAGHVCQVSVTPEAQGRGLGTFLLVRALDSFRRRGLDAVSLSVTVHNQRARQLYQRLGFRLKRAFGAHAWVPPPERIELPS
jgi:ribosomal protein S18 acetylase RimI-like enzyme